MRYVVSEAVGANSIAMVGEWQFKFDFLCMK